MPFGVLQFLEILKTLEDFLRKIIAPVHKVFYGEGKMVVDRKKNLPLKFFHQEGNYPWSVFEDCLQNWKNFKGDYCDWFHGRAY